MKPYVSRNTHRIARPIIARCLMTPLASLGSRVTTSAQQRVWSAAAYHTFASAPPQQIFQPTDRQSMSLASPTLTSQRLARLPNLNRRGIFTSSLSQEMRDDSSPAYLLSSLREASEQDPPTAVRLFESYANKLPAGQVMPSHDHNLNRAIIEEYIKALAKTNKISRLDYRYLQAMRPDSVGIGGGGAGETSTSLKQDSSPKNDSNQSALQEQLSSGSSSLSNSSELNGSQQSSDAPTWRRAIHQRLLKLEQDLDGRRRAVYERYGGLPVQSGQFQNNYGQPTRRMRIGEILVLVSWRLIMLLARLGVTVGMFAILMGGVQLIGERAGQNLRGGADKADKFVVKEVSTKMDDIKGVDEVKEELVEVIEYLKHPEKFDRLGAKMPKGVLLSGSPGTGKTMLARAVAGEAGVPFFQASGSEFDEMFVGLGAKRVRDLFSQATKNTPCIIFVDEIDALASKRNDRDPAASRQTINELLRQLDGFEENKGIVVICATNFPEALDPALLRPGRLDKRLDLPRPNQKGRLEILEHYGSHVTLDPDCDLAGIASRTAGMSGADLFNIINLAAIRCSVIGLPAVTNEELESAFDRVVVGLENKTMITPAEKKKTAYHEAGHALVSLRTVGSEPLHKVTVLPRGGTLGATWYAPDKDSAAYSHKRSELMAQLDIAMGGRAAEELIYGPREVSGGCASDLRQASKTARTMVTQLGMGPDMEEGIVSMPVDESRDKLGSSYSEKTRAMVDEAVERLLNDAYQRAANILKKDRRVLDKLADALVQFETLDREEINLVITGQSFTAIEKLRSERAAKIKNNAEMRNRRTYDKK
eukprot:GHVN01055113.1.p1 GENE.GHVN01055113.1~~GHVN01055113.1.p1  ORF type:complete len:820 (+),score=132.04 GHVN01055113.1:1622-4081(+)